MATMSSIITAIILFIEIQSISSLTGYQIQEQERAGSPQVYATPNGPIFTFNPNPPFNPNAPRHPSGPGPFQRPYPQNGNLVIHNPYFSNPNGNAAPPDAPKPDIPSAKGPPVFTFNPQAQAPYQPPAGSNGAPLPPPPGSRPFDPNQMNPRPIPIPRPHPSDPQTPQSPPPPPKKPEAPQDASGPIVNAQSSNQEVFIRHGQVERETFLYSTQAQVLVGTLAAFFSLCALIRCYSKCCWDRPKKKQTMGHDEYQRGAAVSRQNTNHIEADIDWSDNTENEDDPLEDAFDDDDDNAMTDIQQMRSRKARELVPDESIDSGIYSNADDRLEIDQCDVEILMEEDDVNANNNKEQYPLTDDETRAIMKEFKDTDDEYVD